MVIGRTLLVCLFFTAAGLPQEGIPPTAQGERVAPDEGGAQDERDAFAVQEAVSGALDWLARHQDPDGFWDADGFRAQCTGKTRCAGRGMPLNDVGVTGLGLLAFVNAGHTIDRGHYKEVVRAGAEFLRHIQDPGDGCLVPKEGLYFMYNHAIGTLALIEVCGLSRSPELRRFAQKAVDYIHASKNTGKAWRYNNGTVNGLEANDMSVTGWMVLCLVSARKFGLETHDQDLEDALKYIDFLTDPDTGRTGYMEKGTYPAREPGDENIWVYEETESITALAMLCRVLIAREIDSAGSQRDALEAGAELLRRKPPRWDRHKGSIDYYYWYFGTYAMVQMEDRFWTIWHKKMVDAIVENQAREGCAKGSWPPEKDPWGDNGGRVYSTALLALCLQVY